MKKFLKLLFVTIISVTLASCASTYGVTTVSTEPSVDVVIQYGQPYYTTNGLVSYYVYNGWYCYPYYYNNVYRFHYYRSPIVYRNVYYRPIPRNYRYYRPSYYYRPSHHYVRPYHGHGSYSGRGHHFGGRR